MTPKWLPKCTILGAKIASKTPSGYHLRPLWCQRPLFEASGVPPTLSEASFLNIFHIFCMRKVPESCCKVAPKFLQRCSTVSAKLLQSFCKVSFCSTARCTTALLLRRSERSSFELDSVIRPPHQKKVICGSQKNRKKCFLFTFRVLTKHAFER